MLRRLLPAAAFAGAALLTSSPLAAQSPSEFYDQQCAGCHTIGGGAAAGPDLRDVSRRRDRDWLIRFLLDPDAFKSDPVVVRMIEESGGLEMPRTEGLTREMAAALIDLIDQRSGATEVGSGATKVAPYGVDAGATKVAPYGLDAGATKVAPYEEADIARGHDLFTGRARLSSDGPPCVHCHDAATLAAPGGGRMGPDLTRVTERLGGARGVAGWLRAAPTPVMRAVYARAALSPEEPRLLAAFLDDASARAPVPPQSRAVPFVTAALVLGTIAVALIGALGSQRFRGVRAPMVDAATRRRRPAGGAQ
jgi:cytochrome c2